MSVSGDSRSCGHASEEIRLGPLSVSVVRPDTMEGHVDAERLLADGEAPEPPYWMHLWPGAVALARRLASAPGVGPDRRVLELGCGLAVPGVVAARRGAMVVACDWLLDPLRFARRSAAANQVRLDLLQMDWSRPALRGRFDLIVGADIAYAEGDEPAIVDTLTRLLAPGGAAWLADSVNTYRPTLRRRLEAAGFAVTDEEVRERSEGHYVWVRILSAARPV